MVSIAVVAILLGSLVLTIFATAWYAFGSLGSEIESLSQACTQLRVTSERALPSVRTDALCHIQTAEELISYAIIAKHRGLKSNARELLRSAAEQLREARLLVDNDKGEQTD